jgi:hypothetical protein
LADFDKTATAEPTTLVGLGGGPAVFFLCLRFVNKFLTPTESSGEATEARRGTKG